MKRQEIKSQNSARNDPFHPGKIISFILALFFSASTLIMSGCGLFYDFEASAASENTGEAAYIQEGDIYMVKEVIDGDTMILAGSERIRLIGINTPEYGMYFYGEAKEVLEVLVLGEEVMLEKDISEIDKYGRLLRYAYIGELMINLEMVKRGFANAFTYPPDVKYAELFLEAERHARSNELGLWERSNMQLVDIGIHYDAEGNDGNNLNDEYVMIKNIGEDLIDIGGWTVKDSATKTYEFKSFKLEPGQSVYLYTGDGKDSGGIFYWNSPMPVWNNDFDTLYLRDDEGLLVGIYNY